MKHVLFFALLFSSGCTFFEHVKIARSLRDKNVASKPAQFMITIPEDEEEDETYAVDAGVAYLKATTVRGVNTQLALGGEYHRTNLLAEPIDSLSAVLSGNQVWGNIARRDDPIWFPGASVIFKKDRVQGTESLIPAVDLTVFSKRARIGDLIGRKGPITLEWQPSLGTEIESITKAEQGQPTGRVGRWWVGADINVYPAWRLVKSHVQLSGSFRFWQDYAESDALDSGVDRHYLRIVSLNVFFDDKRRFGVGIDHVSGENPSEGEPEQHYTQLAFKIHVK